MSTAKEKHQLYCSRRTVRLLRHLAALDNRKLSEELHVLLVSEFARRELDPEPFLLNGQGESDD